MSLKAQIYNDIYPLALASIGKFAMLIITNFRRGRPDLQRLNQAGTVLTIAPWLGAHDDIDNLKFFPKASYPERVN